VQTTRQLALLAAIVAGALLAAIAISALLDDARVLSARDREGGSIESTPLAKNPEERAILDVLDDLDRNHRRGMMNVPREDGRLLRLLTEAIDARHVVEIGTSSGYSGIWLCLALRSTGGRLTTFEIDEERAGLARQNFERAGVSDLVTLVLGDAHEKIVDLEGPIDIVFLDADKEGYVDYMEKLLPLVRPGGLVIAHNMSRPGPYPEFLEIYTDNPDLETIFLHMEAAGIGVALKKRG
jgi:predicted O-methyltransferase YrrM